MSRQRKKKGRPVSGWVVLDKPVGMGSTEAVSKIKWLFQAEKAGHAGTLDPLASGMLPIALGEATKTVPYVQDGAKIYRFTVAWGEERSTDDLEGPVTKSSDARPSETEVRALLPKYTGLIMQIPPQFSAIKIAGERAYDLARDGGTVASPATWAATSAATATSPTCVAPRSIPLRPTIWSRCPNWRPLRRGPGRPAPPWTTLSHMNPPPPLKG